MARGSRRPVRRVRRVLAAAVLDLAAATIENLLKKLKSF
jgi:hypothetical protein